MPRDPIGRISVDPENRIFETRPEPKEYADIPGHIRAALDGWKDGTRLHHGHFITAVLENNLSEAICRADLHNRRALHSIVLYCLNELPAACWGNPRRVREWALDKQNERLVREAGIGEDDA